MNIEQVKDIAAVARKQVLFQNTDNTRDLIITLTYFLDKLNQPREHTIYTTCTATLWWDVWDVFYLEMRLCDMIFLQ